MVAIDKKKNIWINADQDQFMVGKVRKEEDKDTGVLKDVFVSERYFTTLKSLIRYLALIEVRNAVIEDSLSSVHERIESLVSNVEKALSLKTNTKWEK